MDNTKLLEAEWFLGKIFMVNRRYGLIMPHVAVAYLNADRTPQTPLPCYLQCGPVDPITRQRDIIWTDKGSFIPMEDPDEHDGLVYFVCYRCQEDTLGLLR